MTEFMVTGAQTFDNGLVDDRGRIKMHFDRWWL